MDDEALIWQEEGEGSVTSAVVDSSAGVRDEDTQYRYFTRNNAGKYARIS